jgi:HAD superfamily hydrolase (TIGR01490 family)
LVDAGIVDRHYYEQTNHKFYEDYKQGKLDIVKFLQFSLAPLALHDAEQLYSWRAEFVKTRIKPIVLPAALALVDKHRQQGDTLLVITATNRFITTPIVELFGIEHLLATTPEFLHGQYTGKFTDAPCYQAGKITHLQQWLTQNQASMEGSWFYSDSHNDLPLLSLVSHPVAVDPDETLLAHAQQQNWPVISLRGGD